MNPESTKTLIGAAALCIFAGMIVLSPHGQLFLYGLAAVAAAVPAIFSSKKLRIVSIIVLLASLALAASVYPEYANYLNRAKEKSLKDSHPAPSQHERK